MNVLSAGSRNTCFCSVILFHDLVSIHFVFFSVLFCFVFPSFILSARSMNYCLCSFVFVLVFFVCFVLLHVLVLFHFVLLTVPFHFVFAPFNFISKIYELLPLTVPQPHHSSSLLVPNRDPQGTTF